MEAIYRSFGLSKFQSQHVFSTFLLPILTVNLAWLDPYPIRNADLVEGPCSRKYFSKIIRVASQNTDSFPQHTSVQECQLVCDNFNAHFFWPPPKCGCICFLTNSHKRKRLISSLDKLKRSPLVVKIVVTNSQRSSKLWQQKPSHSRLEKLLPGFFFGSQVAMVQNREPEVPHSTGDVKTSGWEALGLRPSQSGGEGNQKYHVSMCLAKMAPKKKKHVWLPPGFLPKYRFLLPLLW